MGTHGSRCSWRASRLKESRQYPDWVLPRQDWSLKAPPQCQSWDQHPGGVPRVGKAQDSWSSTALGTSSFSLFLLSSV